MLDRNHKLVVLKEIVCFESRSSSHTEVAQSQRQIIYKEKTTHQSGATIEGAAIKGNKIITKAKVKRAD